MFVLLTATRRQQATASFAVAAYAWYVRDCSVYYYDRRGSAAPLAPQPRFNGNTDQLTCIQQSTPCAPLARYWCDHCTNFTIGSELRAGKTVSASTNGVCQNVSSCLDSQEETSTSNRICPCTLGVTYLEPVKHSKVPEHDSLCTRRS